MTSVAGVDLQLGKPGVLLCVADVCSSIRTIFYKQRVAISTEEVENQQAQLVVASRCRWKRAGTDVSLILCYRSTVNSKSASNSVRL